MDGKVVAVTGCAGLIGSHAWRELRDRGWAVTGISHERPADDGDAIAVDLCGEGASDVLGEIAPQVLVHCAAVLPDAFEGEEAERAAEANRTMDDCVIGHCAESGCRLVYLSTMSIYGSGEGGARGEESETDPAGPYAAAKLRSEAIIAERLGSWCVLRISSPFGLGQRGNVLTLFVGRAVAGEPVRYFGAGSRSQDFVSARDVARAIAMAADSSKNGIYNVASGTPVSMKALAELVVRELESESVVEAADRPDPQEGFEARYAIDKAERELGWRPEGALAGGIRELAEGRRRGL